MDAKTEEMFVTASVFYASSRKLNLTHEQLRGLYDECHKNAFYRGDIPMVAITTTLLGDVNFELSQFKEAAKHYNIYLKLLKYITAGEVRCAQYNSGISRDRLPSVQCIKTSESNTCISLGCCYKSLEQYDKAICHLQMGLNIAEEIEDLDRECGRLAYDGLGRCYYFQKHYDKAIHYFERYLDIEKQMGDKEGEGQAYGILGDCFYRLGQQDKAIYYYQLYLHIVKQTGEKEREVSAFCKLGNCYYSLKQYETAIQYYEMHSDIASQVEGKALDENAYFNLGNCYHYLRQYEKAIQHHEAELKMAKLNGNKENEVYAYNNLGWSYQSLGQYHKAIQQHNECVNIAKVVEDIANEGLCYRNLGNCYRSLGQYEKAIQYHEMELNIAKNTQERKLEGMVYDSLGSCYKSLGQCNEAIKHHKRARNIAKQLNDKQNEAYAEGNLGSCYDSLGQYEKALELHRRQLCFAKELKDKTGELKGYLNLGNCCLSLGQYNNAIQFYEKGLNVSKQNGEKESEGFAYGNLGNCYSSLGQLDKAIYVHVKQVNISKQIGDKAGEARGYCNLGVCYYDLQRFEETELNLKNCIQCFDELFENVPKQDQFKVSVRDNFVMAYKMLVITLWQQEKLEQALVVAEKGRARALAELLLTSYSVLFAKCTNTKVLTLCEILEVVKVLGNTVMFLTLGMKRIFTWLIQLDGRIVFKAKHITVSSNSMKHNRLLTYHDCVAEEINSLIYKACNLRKLRCTVKCEDRSLAFLYSEEENEEAQTEVRDSLSSSMIPADVAATELEISRESPIFCKDSLKELYEIVLGPVRHLVEGSQLIVVPEGPLHLVPYAALIDEEGNYVAESLEVRLVLSLTTAKMIMECPQNLKDKGKPLIVGDPDAGPRWPRLPCARKEAEMVGTLLNTQPLTGKEATKQKFLQDLEHASLIHIAAHGDMKRGEILLASSPEASLVEPKKEHPMLLMSDLENKRLRARLVVLSCCHSARGEVRAEGVIGIARAFIGAGARSVLVALWAIEDDATLFFMGKFYEHLIEGERANASLNKAMAAMRNTATFCEPRHWAPFVLIGDDITIC